MQSTRIGSYSSLKGMKAFSTSGKSQRDFFSPSLHNLLLSGSEEVTVTLETPIPLQNVKREDATKYGLREKYEKYREPLENSQTGEKPEVSLGHPFTCFCFPQDKFPTPPSQNSPLSAATKSVSVRSRPFSFLNYYCC